MAEAKQGTNTATQLKNYFSVPEKPVALAEMAEFWKSLNDDEKTYYRNIDLATGLPRD